MTKNTNAQRFADSFGGIGCTFFIKFGRIQAMGNDRIGYVGNVVKNTLLLRSVNGTAKYGHMETSG